jgi:hypothetical protein
MRIPGSDHSAEFKHDVAFSFLARDLGLATKLADALAPLPSFVYARSRTSSPAPMAWRAFGPRFGTTAD